jgi:hypothetical protein
MLRSQPAADLERSDDQNATDDTFLEYLINTTPSVRRCVLLLAAHRSTEVGADGATIYFMEQRRPAAA